MSVTSPVTAHILHTESEELLLLQTQLLLTSHILNKVLTGEPLCSGVHFLM